MAQFFLQVAFGAYSGQVHPAGVVNDVARMGSAMKVGVGANVQEIDQFGAAFPNPASDQLFISLKGFAGFDVDLIVYNALGQE